MFMVCDEFHFFNNEKLKKKKKNVINITKKIYLIFWREVSTFNQDLIMYRKTITYENCNICFWIALICQIFMNKIWNKTLSLKGIF